MKKRLCLLMALILTCGAVTFAVERMNNRSSDNCNQLLQSNEGAYEEYYDCKACEGKGYLFNLTCRACRGKMSIPKRVKCNAYGCNNGYTKNRYGDDVKCRKCNGAGYYTQEVTCSVCGGVGSPKCSKCNGSGRVRHN